MSLEERRELRLKSVAGAPDMVYPWPLTVGKGRVKKGEDVHDQAVEIIDTIRWMCVEHPEIRSMMGELLHSYKKTSWEYMHRSDCSHSVFCKFSFDIFRLTSTFNESISRLLTEDATRETAKARLHQRPNRKMLKHIIQQVRPLLLSSVLTCLNPPYSRSTTLPSPTPTISTST